MAELAKTRKMLDFEPHSTFTEAEGEWKAKFHPEGYPQLHVEVDGETREEAESNILLEVRRRSKDDSDVSDLWKKFVEKFAVEEPIPEEELRERASLVERSHTATADFLKLTNETFDEAMAGDTPVLVDLWAEWCMPCHMLAPVLKDLSDRLGGRVRFAKLNVDENEGFRERFDILGIPTVILFSDGKEVFRFVGAGRSADQLMNDLEPFIRPSGDG